MTAWKTKKIPQSNTIQRQNFMKKQFLLTVSLWHHDYLTLKNKQTKTIVGLCNDQFFLVQFMM